MFFFIVHQILNGLPVTSEWSESKKNCLTLLVGGNLYVLFFVLLEWIQKTTGETGQFWAGSARNFYYWFIGIDAFAMAILYKRYWGRSILNEVTEHAEEEWDYDDADHKYKRKGTVEHFKDYGEHLVDAEKIPDQPDTSGDPVGHLDQ